MIFELFKKYKNKILERWFDLILESYPSETSNIMKREKDQFLNPVGTTISKEIEVLFRMLCEDIDIEECRSHLDSIIKIRSVQDFSPSKAVEFVFFLKKAIADVLKNEILKESLIEEWLNFQLKIDRLALQAFDLYMGCREKIYEIKVNQARIEKDMAFRMMERMISPKEKD